MTDSISQRDAYARTTEATVHRAEETPDGMGVVLDRTVFYPGGGGQPADIGWLRRATAGEAAIPSGAPTSGDGGHEWRVTGIRRIGSDLAHIIEGGAAGAPVPGDHVTAAIDWDRRHLLMRTHTALHTLCGVVWRDYGALVTGGNMEPGSGRMDFEFERMSGELVAEIEQKVNDELSAARDVRVRVLPREEAFAIPDLIRTKINLLPPGIEEIRTIEIVGLDLQADGGTHVSNTREVGQIRVQGYESKGRINKRIRIALVDE
jgi:misacylated tRNA(Ala) deacylase